MAKAVDLAHSVVDATRRVKHVASLLARVEDELAAMGPGKDHNPTYDVSLRHVHGRAVLSAVKNKVPAAQLGDSVGRLVSQHITAGWLAAERAKEAFRTDLTESNCPDKKAHHDAVAEALLSKVGNVEREIRRCCQEDSSDELDQVVRNVALLGRLQEQVLVEMGGGTRACWVHVQGE